MTYLDHFDSLVNFKRDVLKPALEGKPFENLPFPEGMQEVYTRWVEVKGTETLLKMTLDDRLLSFTDFVREENKRRAEAAVKTKLNPAERKRFSQAVARGQYLCVQDRSGAFTKIVPRYALEKKDALTTVALSDTCAGASSNWLQVCDEQSALLFAQKLREQHFLVQSIEVKEDTVRAEVVHPKTGTYTVTVDLNAPLNEMLVFVFTNASGERSEVAMDKVGEAYGILDNRVGTLDQIMKEGQRDAEAHLMLNSSHNQAASTAAQAAIAAALATQKAQSMANQSAEDYRNSLIPQALLPDGRQVANVQAAKSNVAARMEAQAKVNKDTEENAQDAYARYKESLKTARSYKDEQKARFKKNMEADQKRNKNFLKVALSGVAGSSAVTAFMSWIAL